MEVGLFFPPTTGNQEELSQGMAGGQRPDLYQRMLRELTELAQSADGLWILRDRIYRAPSVH